MMLMFFIQKVQIYKKRNEHNEHFKCVLMVF